MSSNGCTHVTAACPVEATLYGYTPNLGANTFFTTLFAILFIAQICLGTYFKTWSYMTALSLGCLGKPVVSGWSQAGLEIQICCLVLAPSFIAAGLYLNLKHTALLFGSEYGRIPPQRYPQIFILADLGSIIIQAIGGGVAAFGASISILNIGDDLIIAGIAIQIFTMMVLGILSLDFYLHRRKSMESGESSRASGTKDVEGLPYVGRQNKPSPHRTNAFFTIHSSAYLAILIRCIYRIHEMAGGWGNPRMRDETLFLILDGAMVAFATVAMTVAHPAMIFDSTNQKQNPEDREKENGMVEG